MNILFTGASSFTGYWFARELAEKGYRITAPLLRARRAYEGIRKQRVDLLSDFAQVVESCSFGSSVFLNLITQKKWDFLCHHAAEVTLYKSPEFDYLQALQRNTFRIEDVLKRLPAECTLILTGSVFEQGEGVSSEPLRAVSPYGLSKGFTSALIEYYCNLHRVAYKKFVIPNPFGPLEEERFTTYLVKQWLSGKIPELQSPGYVRDNIPVTLLAKAYAHFVGESKSAKYSPSYRPETMEQFVAGFAREMQERMGIPCPFLCKQTEPKEPLIRTNVDLISPSLDWEEEKFWDQLAEFYQQHCRLPAKV